MATSSAEGFDTAGAKKGRAPGWALPDGETFVTKALLFGCGDQLGEVSRV